jgi:hypothetical protein
MSCFFRLISLLGLLIGGSVASVQLQTAEPEIVSLTCSQGVVMGYRPQVQFAWQTQHAKTVRAESGYVDAAGAFHPGSWHKREDLPPQGAGSFLMKLANNAVRVCITAPASLSEPVCEVCIPYLENN